MAQLPAPGDLGFAAPQPNTSVAGYQPGAVAQATEVAGARTQQAAQDFAQIRQTEIETQVNDAYVNQYAPAAAQAWQKFHSLQGKDAVTPDENGVTPMQKYIQTLQQARGDLRDKMPGSYGKQLFDMKASRHVEGELDSAAQYTDAQQKVYTLTTSKALQDTYADQATSKFLPQDEGSMRLALNSGLAEIEKFGQSTGQSADTIKQLQSNYTSKTIGAVLAQQAITDPMGAMRRFNGENGHPGLSAEIDDAQMRPQILAHLTERAQNAEQSKFVQDQLNGIPVDANGKTLQAASPNSSIQERGEAALENAKQYATIMHPNDPVYMDRIVTRVKSETREALYQQNLSDAVQWKDIMSGMVAPDGSHLTFSQAMNDPQWAAKFNQMEPKKQGQVRAIFKQDAETLNPNSARLIAEIKGSAVTDRANFLSDISKGGKYDVGTLVGKMPQGEIEQIINMGVSIDKDATRYENVNKLLNEPSVQRVITMAGITPNQIKTKADNYRNFAGAFQGAVEQFQATNKRLPQGQELIDMASRLTTTVTTDPGIIHWTDTHKKVFDLGQNEIVYPQNKDEIAALPTGARYVVGGKRYVKDQK